MVSGLARAARRGVVVRGGAVLERLAGAEVLLFDKTGTLTPVDPSAAGRDSLPHPSRFVSSDPPAQSHTNHWRLA